MKRGALIGLMAVVACGAAPPPEEKGADAAVRDAGPRAVDAGPTATRDGGVAVRDGGTVARDGGDDVDRPPRIDAPPSVTFSELVDTTLTIQVEDEGSPRVFALLLPPGATWDEETRTMSWTPDFTQGGDDYPVRFVADDGVHRVTATTTITITNDVAPPAPMVAQEEQEVGYRRLRLVQRTDDFLDSADRAGRSFEAIVTVPDDPTAASRPVRIRFHGFGGGPATQGWDGEIRIMPHDPDNTYWWGYDDGGFAPYTERRVLHLLEWVLRTYPAADRQRVYAEGGSMGGTGAIMFGLHHARHVAWVESFIGQTISRNHRPSRIAQLTTQWGAPSVAWDDVDATAILEGDRIARRQFVFTKHGKDDPTIHFGAVTFRSPLTNRNWYEALQASRVGHLGVWDEGAHGPVDPVLGLGWWQQGWNPIFDDTTQLRRDQAFAAFSNASHDDDLGRGEGNGTRAFDPESGYAGDVSVAGDTGWDGAIAGAINRHLRWDSTRIVDTIDSFEIPVRVLDGEGGDPPQPGYPTTGDRLGVTPPVRADVTVRRVQAFQTRPGEVVDWTFGTQSGEATANEDGVTIAGLDIGTSWQTLRLTRR